MRSLFNSKNLQTGKESVCSESMQRKERKIIFYFKPSEKRVNGLEIWRIKFWLILEDSGQKAEQMTACLMFEYKVIYIVANYYVSI